MVKTQNTNNNSFFDGHNLEFSIFLNDNYKDEFLKFISKLNEYKTYFFNFDEKKNINKINIKNNFIKGSKLYLPIAESLNSEFLSSERKLLISSKLQTWIENELQTQLNPIKNKIDDDISSQTRRVIFNCFENLGTFSTNDFKDFIKKIDQQSKSLLSKLGIRHCLQHTSKTIGADIRSNAARLSCLA